MKKTILIWLAVMLLCAPLAGAAENLIANPGFEEIDADGEPLEWAREMWDWDEGVSELTLSTDAYAGAYAVRVENIGENDARFAQYVSVEPNTYYRLRCMIKAENCGEIGGGAGISVEDTFISSDYFYDTQGEWTECVLYGWTGEDQTELTLFARVGGYGSLNTGVALFDDFSMERLDELPAGAAAVSFATLPPSDNNAEWAEEESAYGGGTLAALIVAALYLLLAALGVWYISTGAIRLSWSEETAGRVLSVALLAALAVRLVLAVTMRGYGVDMGCFEGWSSRMAEIGPAGFYSEDTFCDYPPGYMYVLWALGEIVKLFGLPYDGRLTWLVIKLPPILLDLAAALLLYRIARDSFGKAEAVLMAILYACNPLAVLDCAGWGQIDAVLALLIALSIYQAVRGKWQVSLPLYAIAVLIKPQALMFGPLGLFALVVEIARGGAERGRIWRRALLGILISLAAVALVAAPFVVGRAPKYLLPQIAIPSLSGGNWLITFPFLNPLCYLIELYAETLQSYNYITINACNLFALLGKNWVPLEQVRGLEIFAWCAFALSYLYAGFLYVRAKNKNRLFLAAAVLLLMLFAFGPKMHERYAFPAILLLLLAYIEDRDARIVGVAILSSVAQFLNISMVLASEHLQDALALINGLVAAGNLVAAGILAWTGWDLCVSGHVISITRVYKPEGRLIGGRETADAAAAARLFQSAESKRAGRFTRLDVLLVAGLTLAYSLLAFVNLGSTKAPETQWKSTAAGESLTFDLGEVETFHLTYFGGICSSTFQVEFSEDGTAWTEPAYARYDDGQIFTWLWYEPCAKDDGEFITLEEDDPWRTARYVRLSAERVGLVLNEVAFLGADGTPLPIKSLRSAGAGENPWDVKNLLDEQDTVPPYPSYYNGMYFDEIYHGRTAYEHLHGLHAYEYTHPPLGKVLIMVGVKLFGMTPFGWRFSGTLFGVLMLPVMYALAKMLMKKTSLAFIATFLLAVDCMHFTQSRIATIDVYGVFFIMLMYLFMYKYSQMNFNNEPLWRTLVPLSLCGVSMGLGIASKWIGVYAALGLAVLWLIAMCQRGREISFARRNMKQFDPEQKKLAQAAVKNYARNVWTTLGFCVVFFVVVPLLIYYFSYYWQLAPDGGLSVQKVWDTQVSMFEYHQGLTDDTHYFRSPWYEWPLIVKPMWYYSGNRFMPEGWVSSISCMGNPAVWWGGFLALLYVAGQLLLREHGDKRYHFVLIGFLSQYLPWIGVGRSTFIYHYFASVPFIILCIALVCERIARRNPRAFKIASIAFCGAALALFAGFYPIISGTPVPRAYAMLLRWFGWYNF